MNRGQGVVTAGVILLGAALGPSIGIGSAAREPAAEPRSAAATAIADKVKGEGPWIASCHYWEVVDDLKTRPAKDGAPENFTIKVTGMKGKVEATATSEPEEEPACERDGDLWGIPKSSLQVKPAVTPAVKPTVQSQAEPQVKPQITAIIAAVPDPIHTHLALEYDRAIDALLQAGADNGFTQSFYWMPWKNQNEPGHTAEAGEAGKTTEQHKREQQPGLVVLKHFANKSDGVGEYPSSGFDRVIYLFVVGESPATGMNGKQLANALRYEHWLKNQYPDGVTLSMRPNDLAVIGSESSGAAASMREALQAAKHEMRLGTVTIAGATDTREANDWLNNPIHGDATGFTYISFGPDTHYVEKVSHQKLKDAGFNPNRFAMMLEDGTVFGESGARESLNDRKKAPANESGAKNDAKTGQADKGMDAPPLIIRFPREISLLRNAKTKEPIAPSSVPSPYLHLTLKDPVVDDTIPHFSVEQTPLSQEAALMSIQRELLKYRVQFLTIYASNVLDEIFLANFLHRACPNVRLIFMDSADLLLEREAENGPYIGSITVTPYNLIGLMRTSGGRAASRVFPNGQSEAVYNAASYTFHQQLPTDLKEGEAVRLKKSGLLALVEKISAGELNVSITRKETVIDRLGVAPGRIPANQVRVGDRVTLYAYGLTAVVQQVTSRENSDLLTVELDPAKFTVPLSDATRNPPLAGYEESNELPEKPGSGDAHSSLWATLVGNDGYYPLGLVSHCASDMKESLPTFKFGEASKCDPQSGRDEFDQLKSSAPIYPSLLWTIMGIVLGLYCVGHTLLLLVAWYWSPFTRDMAISQMAEPCRRAVYMNIGAAMLFLMAVVLEIPAFRIGPALQLNTISVKIAFFTLTAASLTLIVTVWKTAPYSRVLPDRAKSWYDMLDTRRAGYLLFNLAALAAVIGVPLVWWYICSVDLVGAMDTKYGMFFSYRCLHPDSEVSPVVPVLLVLLGWYLWAMCQTYRLRFSEVNRPRLPKGDAPKLYVSDCALGSLSGNTCNMKQSFHLYENISCLLITREMLTRFMPVKSRKRIWASAGLAIFYLALFCLATNVRLIESVDRILLAPGDWPTMYERLLGGLLAPLIFIALAGALRMVLIWGALRRGVLEPLDRYPLRNAFNRLKGLGWIAMMRDTGLHLRWKDMARTGEAISQVLNHEDIRNAFFNARQTHWDVFRKAYKTEDDLKRHVAAVRKLARGDAIDAAEEASLVAYSKDWDTDDLPAKRDRLNLAGIYVIEKDYARICEAVLETVLIPYWTEKRRGLVAAEGTGSSKDAGPHEDRSSSEDPEHIQVAEELIALRYVSLIRAVLGNVRYLMTFVAAVFVVSLVAWHSYPFQPRQMGDWVFTMVFVVLGSVTVTVFAQMHRDAILSRITDTKPNELGIDFFMRMATFGAIPLLTWIAYQFPSIGSGLFHLLQPGLGAIK